MKQRNSDMKLSRYLGVLAVGCAILVLTTALCSAALRPVTHLRQHDRAASETAAYGQHPPSHSVAVIVAPGRMTRHGHGCCCGAAVKQVVRKDESSPLARLLVASLGTPMPDVAVVDSSDPAGGEASSSQPAVPFSIPVPLRI